jgi:hypothetical protein
MVATNGSGAGAARHDVEEIFAELAAPQPPAQPEFDEDQAADHAREYFTQQFKDHLNPATGCLVWNFALALGNKLADAEKKYGYTDGWRSTDWMDECRTKLLEHVAKGDPRDVAAYCAFLWHHGERTAMPAQPEPASADAEDAWREGWAAAYSGNDLYTDDGELQDNRVAPFIDWRRDSARDIKWKITMRAIDAARATKGGE